MKKTMFAVLTTLFISVFFSINTNAQGFRGTEEAVRNLKPYPANIDSLERHVIFVEPKQNENLFEVELIAGKVMEVDCNRHRLMGNFSKDDVQGWGFSYYVFNTNGEIVSTMMACPEPKTEKFVTAQTIQTRYNSRMPIVVYLPQGMELRYRIWSGGEEAVAERK